MPLNMKILNGTYREFRLDNGLFVALQNTPTQTVSGRLRVWHGSLNEQKGEEGIAHFLEHSLILGGSQKYTPEKSKEIRGTFAYFNAFTALDRTFFPVDMLAEDTDLFIKYISDTVFNPKFDKSKVEEERQRVLREMSNVKSHNLFADRRAYNETLFGKDSQHVYFGLGKEEIINAATIEDLDKFHKRGYSPNNADLICVGALPENIEGIIRDNFSEFKQGSGKKIEFARNPPLSQSTIYHYSAPELINQDNPEQSNAQLKMSIVAPNEIDEDSYAFGMLAKILGGDTNSRLFTSISQKKGLAYGIGALYDLYNNQGVVDFNGQILATKANEAIDIIFEEMSKLRTELVPQDSLDRLKRNSRYHIAKTYEFNAGHVASIELLLDKGLTPEYILKKIEEVTPEKIREVAIKYLPQDRENGKYVLSLRDPLKK